ncbi:MAG TPA: insulinase family protein, partial [Tepidisphaeraceae bacterium]
MPNNACLIIAGDIDIPQTKKWVHEYFGWIPKGPLVPRDIPAEPEQTQARSLIIYKPNVPLTNIFMGFKTADYRSDDHYALQMLSDILASGQTGRLDRQFVNSAEPSCVEVGADDQRLEDVSFFLVEAVVQQGKAPDDVQKQILAAIYELADKGVTQEELDKVRTQTLDAIIESRQTCASIATELGDQQVFGGDAERVNRMIKKINALTPADIQAVAKKYIQPQRLTAVQYRPDPLGINARKAAALAAIASAKATETKNAGVVPSTEPIAQRVQNFPSGYPTEPPTPAGPPHVVFNKGVEQTVNGLNLITLSDHHLPLVNVSLIMPGGGEAQPPDKTGVDSTTAEMLSRGSAGIPFLQLADDLESRGISIDASAEVDTTRLVISCVTDQLDYAVKRANQMLASPDFPAEEFDKLKQQSLGELMQSL